MKNLSLLALGLLLGGCYAPYPTAYQEVYYENPYDYNTVYVSSQAPATYVVQETPAVTYVESTAPSTSFMYVERTVLAPQVEIYDPHPMPKLKRYVSHHPKPNHAKRPNNPKPHNNIKPEHNRHSSSQHKPQNHKNDKVPHAPHKL